MKILTRQEVHKDREEHPWTSFTREKFILSGAEVAELEQGKTVLRGTTAYELKEEEVAE